MLRRRLVSSPLAAGGPPVVVPQCRWQTQHSLGSSRDKQRAQQGADPNTGNQASLIESPDLTNHLKFGLNALEHVQVRELSAEERARTEVEKERAMRERFGEHGPGERLTKSSQQVRQGMLAEQQDVDGLPWEVRWRKALIPTSEEIVQDVRDRFDLFVQDPIEREQEWYLHWKDRAFKIQKDRMIWPQGYTDYLDHYDEHGRRRVLPTEQRWSDSSWKHLADTRYKDRMWLIEGEERKAVHRGLQPDATLMEQEDRRQLEMGDVFHGITAGVVDLDPDQAYHALAGSADPLEVARAKMKVQSYGAHQALGGDKSGKAEIDPISGFPKADMPPLPSGITVEQAAAVLTETAVQNEQFEQRAEAARQSGEDPTTTYMKVVGDASRRHGGQPVLRAQAEARVQRIKERQAELRAMEQGGQARPTHRLEAAMDTLERGVQAQTGAQASGFIEVAPRPPDAEPDVAGELYRVPKTQDLEEMPEWYRQTLVDTDPLIVTYGTVHDPLEELPSSRPQYYEPPVLTEEDRITRDDAVGGVSAFDETKAHKLRSLPELVEGYKPLPLFREVQQGEGAGEVVAKARAAPSAPLKKSQKLRKERQERMRQEKLKFDTDIMLPALPWETDSVVDPYRGVSREDAVDFNKPNLEKTWRAYRESFQQCLTEFGNLTQVTSEDKCERMLLDSAERFRNGVVGEHPEIPEEQEEVFRLIFEAHAKHFLADFYKFKGGRATESATVKAAADEMLRRASAKSKLLGQNFMNFVQEMTSLELDTIRKNPVQRYVILVRDRKYEPIAKPFMKWIKSELGEFAAAEFQSLEQLDTNREFLSRHLNEARIKVPSRIDGITDSARDAAVEAFFHWCRGALCFYSGRHCKELFTEYADTRFRARAEELFEDSMEWFGAYAKAANNVVQIPIPDSDPPYEYDEKEFLDGESATFAEISGHLDKAEAIWHSGSTKRWYPMTDETEYMWYCERRGRLTLALDISDRCLESMNKKTHPSVHPFPERARKFLEGAPLTQETAEHLWLRYMGDLYWEHSEMMFRNGRYQTGRSYREKCLNLYHLAVRTAKERLPPSWRAPLLTEAKYLMHVYEPGCDVGRHLADVERTVDRLYEEREPAHWVDPSTELPMRVAVLHANLAAYGEHITATVRARLANPPTNEQLLRYMEHRAQGGGMLPELEEYFSTVNEVADTVFRRKVLRWRAREVEGSDPYLFLTHLYFAFRVYPKDAEEVQRMWDMYEPVFLYIYTQCAMASRPRGERLISDALRRMCQVLLAGNREQKRTLMEELTKVRERMSHIVNRKELDRAINALDAHLDDPRKPVYVYGTALLYREAVRHEKIARSPLLRSEMAAADYAELKRRQETHRQASSALNPHEMSKMQDSTSNRISDEPVSEEDAFTTRRMFDKEE